MGAVYGCHAVGGAVTPYFGERRRAVPLWQARRLSSATALLQVAAASWPTATHRQLRPLCQHCLTAGGGQCAFGWRPVVCMAPISCCYCCHRCCYCCCVCRHEQRRAIAWCSRRLSHLAQAPCVRASVTVCAISARMGDFCNIPSCNTQTSTRNVQQRVVGAYI